MISTLTAPPSIAKLPKNKAGYFIPKFVTEIDGVPDFSVINSGYIVDCVRFNLCWICGERKGRYGSYVIGPMCAVNRVSGEPPSHYDCAVYAAQVCPFLANPNMTRRERRMPEGSYVMTGHIPRNPGVAVVWTSRSVQRFRNEHGWLWNIGDPSSVEWFAHGRAATRAEVMESIESGLLSLRAETKSEGADAMAHLDRLYARALTYLPAE